MTNKGKNEISEDLSTPNLCSEGNIPIYLQKIFTDVVRVTMTMITIHRIQAL